MILNAPMGSGKSWLMCLLSAQKMNTNSALRTIIAVPQTIIAPGFANAKLRMPNGRCIDWKIHHNLCKKGSNKGTIKYIIDWLENDHNTINDRTLICTHATLVAVNIPHKLLYLTKVPDPPSARLGDEESKTECALHFSPNSVHKRVPLKLPRVKVMINPLFFPARYHIDVLVRLLKFEFIGGEHFSSGIYPE